MRRTMIGIVLAFAGVAALATPAAACGFLVAPDGGVRLASTTTLAAYHDGVEHYITSFEFQSSAPEFGSIIPLPGRPTLVERAGSWTLQRLEREVNPPVFAPEDAGASAQAAPTSVISVTHIDALTVTVVAGGGAGVTKWARANGFTLPADTPAALDFYARRSPYFALAKFDAREAAARGFDSGDGIPVHIAIPLRNPWVPLRILAAAKPADEVVRADVFLLTDHRPTMLSGAGLQLARSEPASTSLLNDLRSDKHSSWVPQHAWLTYLRVEVAAANLNYDLAIDAGGHRDPSIVDTGVVTLAETHRLRTIGPAPRTAARESQWPAAIAGGSTVLGLVLLAAVAFALIRSRRRARQGVGGAPAIVG